MGALVVAMRKKGSAAHFHGYTGASVNLKDARK
jgi:hypothetical protein